MGGGGEGLEGHKKEANARHHVMPLEGGGWGSRGTVRGPVDDYNY